MPSAPIAQVFEDVVVSGEAISVLVRDQDATIMTVESSYLMVDPAVDDEGNYVNINPPTRVGQSLIGTDGEGEKWKYIWDANTIVQTRAEFDDEPVFKCNFSSAGQHMFFLDAPPPTSFTFLYLGMVSQATLDAIDAASSAQRYLLSFYDEPHNSFKGGLDMFAGSGLKGWTFTPKSGVSGNPLNIPWSTYPATRPTALVPFAIGWELDWDGLTSDFYFNNFETPIASKAHSAVLTENELLDCRVWMNSFSPGSNSASWGDWSKTFYFSDNSNPTTAMTKTKRMAILADWKAKFGF